jgi:hypothetical protein
MLLWPTGPACPTRSKRESRFNLRCLCSRYSTPSRTREALDFRRRRASSSRRRSCSSVRSTCTRVTSLSLAVCKSVRTLHNVLIGCRVRGISAIRQFGNWAIRQSGTWECGEQDCERGRGTSAPRHSGAWGLGDRGHEGALRQSGDSAIGQWGTGHGAWGGQSRRRRQGAAGSRQLAANRRTARTVEPSRSRTAEPSNCRTVEPRLPLATLAAWYPASRTAEC